MDYEALLAATDFFADADEATLKAIAHSGRERKLVRGDQLFAIFLSQCAALSEKIQMRMLYGRMSEEKV